jgi:hypothetical protein
MPGVIAHRGHTGFHGRRSRDGARREPERAGVEFTNGKRTGAGYSSHGKALYSVGVGRLDEFDHHKAFRLIAMAALT